MGSKIKTSRVVAFGLVVAVLIALCVGTLYNVQILNGAAYYDESADNNVSRVAVTAARGNILDRYGRVLVSNRECYNLVINTTRLFSDEVEDPNAMILEMVNIVEESGEEVYKRQVQYYPSLAILHTQLCYHVHGQFFRKSA